jgi:D-psicose/D-tagatose/L-ribulose 3-epimerase
MKITISNIAWNKEEDITIMRVLKNLGIKGIEIAPTKIWKDPVNETADSIKEYKNFWNKNGITISSTQSVLFGHPELNIFADKESREETGKYLEKMIHVSALLGAQAIVFGSPKNRDTNGMEIEEALDIVAPFFFRLGEIAKKYDTYFCLEPNPKIYGTNFANTTADAIKIIKLVNHPHFRLHLDSGAMTVNTEDYQTAITDGFRYLKHFHISEKDLLPIGTTNVDHNKIAAILRSLHYNRWVSIEMRSSPTQKNKKLVEDTLKLVSSIYS